MPYIKCVTPEQQNALDELKSRVKNESPTLLEEDAIFYKFLKAQRFDVSKAEKMLRKHIVWRKVYDVDNILETFKPNEVFVKYVEPNVIGFDKDGDVVTFLTNINNAELAKCMKINDYIKHWIWFSEKQISLKKHHVEKTGLKPSMTLIIDLDKLDLANATSRITAEIFLRLARLIRDNYAERLKAAYLINSPSYYIFVFMLIKAVMSSVLVKRIHVFGHNGWKEHLLEVIDANVLPAFLGGKRMDPDGDPYCKSFITLSRKIPESYYLSNEERFFKDPTKVKRLIVPALESKEISVNIKEAGSWIRCQFMVISKTIAFGLFFQENEKEMKEIIPIYEYDTSDGTEEKSHKCSLIGRYIIVFDNSHSKFTGKEVQYIISIKKPEI